MSLADIAQHTALGHTGLMKTHSIFAIHQFFKSKIRYGLCSALISNNTALAH